MIAPADDPSVLRPCHRCGAEALLVNPHPGGFYARVHRFRECQDGYHSTCRTPICPAAGEAIAAWNDRFGRPPGG